MGIVCAINEEAFGIDILIKDHEYDQLEEIVRAHPELWPVGLADTIRLLQKKLNMENIDRQFIPGPLINFFDEKFKLDVDPLLLAKQIGHEICNSCEGCGCKC